MTTFLPGHLFVIATLLPLVSFLIIFLLCGVWALARRYEWEGIEKALSSEEASRAAANLAIAAIGLAFVCSLTGSILYYQDYDAHHRGIAVEADRVRAFERQLEMTQDAKLKKSRAEELAHAEDALHAAE